MNEILNGDGLGVWWQDLITQAVNIGGQAATAAINKGNSQNTNNPYNFNDNTNTNTNGGGGTVIVQQQDKTLLYIGVGALALMAIFMITNSGRRK